MTLIIITTYFIYKFVIIFISIRREAGKNQPAFG